MTRTIAEHGRVLAAQILVGGALLEAVHRFVWSYPAPVVGLSVGVLIGAGNCLSWANRRTGRAT